MSTPESASNAVLETRSDASMHFEMKQQQQLQKVSQPQRDAEVMASGSSVPGCSNDKSGSDDAGFEPQGFEPEDSAADSMLEDSMLERGSSTMVYRDGPHLLERSEPPAPHYKTVGQGVQ